MDLRGNARFLSCLARSFAVAAAIVAVPACGDDELKSGTDTSQPEVLLPDAIGGDAEVVDTSRPDTVPADTVPADTTPADTAVQDTAAETRDTTPADTAVQDTTPADTATQDTAVQDTAADTRDTTPADTAVQDTAVQDTAVQDTAVQDTAVQDTAVQDTTPADTGPQQCPPSSVEEVVEVSTIFRQENFSGAPNAVKFTTDLCSDDPDSAERVFRFDLDAPTEIYAETLCGWDCELVLTREGCTNDDVMACETSLGEEAFGQVYNAGTYRLFVEGDNPEDIAPFDLMLNFNRTGGQAVCDADTLNVVTPANCEDPNFGDPRYELSISGQTSVADVDDFFVQDVDGCSSDDAHIGGAPDRVYTFTLPGERDVEITLAPDGWDALLYVTGSPCGARSQVEVCSDGTFGSEETVSATLGAGTWYIVVDGFGEETFDGDASGPFDLDILVFDDACDE